MSGEELADLTENEQTLLSFVRHGALTSPEIIETLEGAHSRAFWKSAARSVSAYMLEERESARERVQLLHRGSGLPRWWHAVANFSHIGAAHQQPEAQLAGALARLVRSSQCADPVSAVEELWDRVEAHGPSALVLFGEIVEQMCGRPSPVGFDPRQAGEILDAALCAPRT